MKLLGFVTLFSLYSLCVGVSTFTNPIKSTDGSDPYMVYSNGYYYLTTTTWSNIQITRATTMAGLKTATPKVVWTDSTASRCCNMGSRDPLDFWRVFMVYVSKRATTIDFDDRLTLCALLDSYYTAGTTGTFDNQRLHVLKGSSTDIWESTWSYASRITIPNRDVWAIDATVLFLSAGPYLVFSSWDGDEQCLWISKMNSATSVGDAVKISSPTNSWERVVANVNEGPAGLYHEGRTWVVYSASSCAGTGYSLGRIELTGSDPLSASSWTKYDAGPIFSAANGDYAPGHNGFFTPPSGNIYLVYHASPTSSVTCDGNRRTMVQAVGWHSDGTPNLGEPRALTDNVPEPA
ncbi:Glycoside hydrolase family 43 protein [Ceratobasidium theobromae]|uniref:Glycoside hydrolase family 43 protein n=1 Tax=Ceratobasidium theobromae TaxID=1582974 RepID=A0A5N5Q9S5_9AGAM|nr:Glycoside hydrolase family 43 protein [Ceratobasidium theobromae]